MPTTNKRINITIPDNIYERLTAYKQRNGISSDAAACLQLIIRQLDGIENGEKMLRMMAGFSLDEVQQLSTMGYKMLHSDVLVPDEKK